MKSLMLLFVVCFTFVSNASEVTFENWKPFTKLGEIELEARVGSINKKVIEKQVRARNYFAVDMCILSKIKKSINTESTFINNGKTIIEAGAEVLLGGYKAVNPNKAWRTKWEFRATKNLKRCE